MSDRRPAVFAVACMLVLGGRMPLVEQAHAAPAPAGKKPSARPTALAAPAPAALCAGDYGDELSVVTPAVRDFERDPQNQYSYCLRTIAVYECLSYAPDASVKRDRKTVVAHGTGFAYRRSGGETYVITNDHVASWPSVTSEEHTVEDVPSGCKLVSEALRIVDDEDDDYDGNDVSLTRVVADPTLDISIAKTRTPLKIIPYRLGKSAALHVGNAVAVHGFPLGAFAATNVGKVVNAYDHDTDKDWDHLDFVVDALLSPGNSGSPVLAVSCRTGEYELVGVYHAGYVRGSALNVVVGIDQVKDLMTTLKRTPRVSDGVKAPAGREQRRAVIASLAGPGQSPFFPFGPLVATARQVSPSALSSSPPTSSTSSSSSLAEGAGSGPIVFEVYSSGFPLRDERLLVIEDLPTAEGSGAFGESGRIFVGNGRGLRACDRASLDGEAQAQLDRILLRLRASAVSAAHFRETDGTTSKGHKRRHQIERTIDRQEEADKDASQALVDLSERLGPKAGERALAYADAIAPFRAEASSATEKAAAANPVTASVRSDPATR